MNEVKLPWLDPAPRVMLYSVGGGIDRTRIGLGVAAATVALLIHSLFVNSILYPPILHTTWILWGIVFVLNRDSEPGELLT